MEYRNQRCRMKQNYLNTNLCIDERGKFVSLCLKIVKVSEVPSTGVNWDSGVTWDRNYHFFQSSLYTLCHGFL